MLGMFLSEIGAPNRVRLMQASGTAILTSHRWQLLRQLAAVSAFL